MKNIYLNLKRFDIPRKDGGINDTALNESYGKTIVSGIEKMNLDIPITIYFQESNLFPALSEAKKIHIGCQGVHYADVSANGNFGAFTTSRTAKSMKTIGVNDCLIGHCEERNHLNYLTSLGGGSYDINLENGSRINYYISSHIFRYTYVYRYYFVFQKKKSIIHCNIFISFSCFGYKFACLPR